MKRNIEKAQGILLGIFTQEVSAQPGEQIGMPYLRKDIFANDAEAFYNFNLLVKDGYIERTESNLLPEEARQTHMVVRLTWKGHRFLEEYEIAKRHLKNDNPVIQALGELALAHL